MFLHIFKIQIVETISLIYKLTKVKRHHWVFEKENRKNTFYGSETIHDHEKFTNKCFVISRKILKHVFPFIESSNGLNNFFYE